MMFKGVLITGSGRGLGRELAMIFAGNSHDIILNAREKFNLENTIQVLSKKEIYVSYVLGDIRNDETINKLSEIAFKEDIEVLINNAGAPSFPTSFEKISQEEIYEIIETNLLSPIKLTREIYPLFLSKKHGTIININSMIGFECKGLKEVGCASRWGLRGFTGSLRLEAEKYGIKIIGVYPTRIKTRPEYEYGFEPRVVAQKIFKAYSTGFSGILKLDGRPKKFIPKQDLEYG